MIGNPDVTVILRHGGRYGNAPPDNRRYLSAYGRDVDMAEVTIERDLATGVFRELDGTGGRTDDMLARLGVKIACGVWTQTTADPESFISKTAAEKATAGNTNDKRSALAWAVEHQHVSVEAPAKPGTSAKVRRGPVKPPGYVPILEPKGSK